MSGIANVLVALVAIATHSHCDHLGALHLAPSRYGHAAEAAVFADPEAVLAADAASLPSPAAQEGLA